MPGSNMYLGKSTEYWRELDKRASMLDVDDLIKDLAELGAKVNYYERKLDEIAKFRDSLSDKDNQ